MSIDKKQLAEVVNNFVDKFFTLCRTLLICSVVVIVAWLFFVTIDNSGGTVLEESRLEKQLRVITTERVYNDTSKSLTADQRAELIAELIKHYDSKTDSLNPIIDKNKKRTNLADILKSFKINESGVVLEDVDVFPEEDDNF